MKLRTRRAGRLVRHGTSLYSQGKEELIVREFLRDRSRGVFVDVGAGHWKHGSTTYYLEHHLAWSGIAVDARSDVAAGYAAHRPSTRFVNRVVTDHSDVECTVYLAGDLTSTDADYHRQFSLARLVEPPTATVLSITLDDLLERNGIEHVDFLSMDIEEGEENALHGFDIRRFSPPLVGIEVGSRRAAAMTKDFFALHGYTRLVRYIPYDLVNWWFVAPDAGRIV